jgi:Holliday junction resolvasome RuvABC endonuclease subunit
MRVLGLDASTTTIGISVIDYDDGYKSQLIHCEYYKPDKSDGLLNMLINTRMYILNIATKYDINEFVIEDYVRFMKGKSSASTTIPLAILNMTLRLSFLDCGIIPQTLNVLKIRHTLKLDKKLPAKEDMPELVAKHLGIQYPWLYRTNRKKEQVIMEESYDIADSIAVALAYIKCKEQSYIVKTQRKKSKKKK